MYFIIQNGSGEAVDVTRAADGTCPRVQAFARAASIAFRHASAEVCKARPRKLLRA